MTKKFSKEKNINSFNRDVTKFSGYQYTATTQLSCKLSNNHLSELIHQMCGDLSHKDVIDIGCGDGTYTYELLKLNPKKVLGVDPASNSIKQAKSSYGHDPRIHFLVENIYGLDNLKQHFDVAVVRGVLHHLYQAETAILQLSRIANVIVIAEPNGYNLILKIIEQVSPYHRIHEEKSYRPSLLDSWIIKNKGHIIASKYCGLVPFFCPAPVARILKKIEPLVEKSYLINKLLTASYLCKYETLSHN